MRRVLWMGSVLVALWGLLGCGGGGQPGLPHLYAADGGQVQGYVYATPIPAAGVAFSTTRDATRAPVSGVVVSIVGWSNHCVTNAAGYFDLANLPTGDYTLQIAHPAYRDPLLQPVQVTAGRRTQVTGTMSIGYYIGVGVGDYVFLNDLQGPPNDLAGITKSLFVYQGIREPLRDQAATKAAIQAAFARAATAMSSADYLIFYYSGHGGADVLPDGTHIDYICPADSLTTGYSKDISDTELRDWISALPNPGHVIVIMDTCFAGSFFDGNLTNAVRGFAAPAQFRALSKTDCTVIASSGHDELTWETDGSGVFTHFLVEGLQGRTPAADANGDRAITAQELYDYAAPKTFRFITTQHPKLQVGSNPVLVRY